MAFTSSISPIIAVQHCESLRSAGNQSGSRTVPNPRPSNSRTSFDFSEADIELSTFQRGERPPSTSLNPCEPPAYAYDQELGLEEIGRTIHESREFRWLSWVVNALLILLPSGFMTLSFIAVHMDEQPISARSSWILDAAKTGPTIYPIMFAAIAGRLMNDIALYHVERGARLGTVEQLVQSDSLASALRIAIVLRNRSVRGLLIVLLWCFSPIGGQSSLRVLAEVDSFHIRNITLTHATGSSSVSPSFDPSAVKNIIQASLRSPQTIKTGPTDSWRNVKIPAVVDPPLLSSGAAHNETLDWTDFEPVGDLDYTALTGVPLWGLPREGNVTFTMPWSFMYTKCQKKPNEWDKWCGNNTTKNNKFCHSPRDGGTLRNGTMWIIDWPYNRTLNSSNTPEFVKLHSWLKCLDPTDGIAKRECPLKFECIIKAAHIDVNISCSADLCQSTSTRRSLTDLRPDFITPWNEWLPINRGARNRDIDGFNQSLIEWPYVVGSDIDGTVLLDSFLTGSSQSDIAVLDGAFTNETDANFSASATSMLNTYWQAMQYPSDIVNGHMGIFPYTSPDKVETDGHRPYYAEVTAQVKTQTRIYRANRVWTTLLFYISFILMVCTVASIIMQSKTRAPDVLGYVSSMTRDNFYFEHYQSGSTLDGASRTRSLQDLKVYVADVVPHMKIGRIALSTGTTAGMPHGRLTLDRKYN